MQPAQRSVWKSATPTSLAGRVGVVKRLHLLEVSHKAAFAGEQALVRVRQQPYLFFSVGFFMDF
jgi:hypothetical protein